MRTREDVQLLKQQWLRDPCWDLTDTTGFEEHREELDHFQTQVKLDNQKAQVEKERSGNGSKPAFPLAVQPNTTLRYTGLTKREWMAATILNGFVSFAGFNKDRVSMAIELTDLLLAKLAEDTK